MLPNVAIALLAFSLVVANNSRAAETLYIEPALALPDYLKVSLAKATNDLAELYPIFALGDYDEDGRLDVAVAFGERPPVPPWDIRVYLQSTNGALQTKVEFPLPNIGRTPTFFSADLNHDGHLDLLLGDLGNDLIIACGNGDGTFQAPQFLGLFAPASPVAAHLNGDQHLDLVSGATNGTVVVFTGSNDGSFTAQAVLNTVINPFLPARGQIMVGDLNCDGNADVAVASIRNTATWTGNLDVFLGNGDGTFQDVISTTNVAAGQSALGDFNGDGLLDCATDRYQPAAVEIWLGQGDGHFGRGETYSMSGYSPVAVQVGDLNGDGILDIFVAVDALGPLSIFLGKGDGTFQARQEFIALPPDGFIFAVGPRLGDFNGDGLPDIVSVAGYTNGQLHDLTVAFNPGAKRDPKLGFLLEVRNSMTNAVGPVVVEASSNLVNWTAVATNTALSNRWSLVDTNVALRRYYRTHR
jgi:hypothetical protein